MVWSLWSDGQLTEQLAAVSDFFSCLLPELLLTMIRTGTLIEENKQSEVQDTHKRKAT